MTECTSDLIDQTCADKSVDYFFGILNLIVGISSIIMNFLVFFVYIRLNWKHPTYFLFINITLHDALSGFTGLYMGVFLFFERPDEADLASGVLGLCKFNGFLWSLTAFTTPTLLCIASAFRFMAIYMPYSYKDKVTLRNASVGVIIGWMVGLLSTMVPIFRGEHYEYKKGLSVCDVDMDTQENLNIPIMVIFILIPLLFPLCVLMLCNAAVLLHLCKCTGQRSRDKDPSPAASQTKRSVDHSIPNMALQGRSEQKTVDIQQHEQPLTAPSSHSSSKDKVPQFGSICEWKHKVARKDYHTATTVVLMTLNYIICYGLWIVYFIHRVFQIQENKTEKEVLFTSNPKSIIYIDATIKLMACLNSALNGIVHIARGSQIRSQISMLFDYVTSYSFGSENQQAGHTATHVNSVNHSKSRG